MLEYFLTIFLAITISTLVDMGIVAFIIFAADVDGISPKNAKTLYYCVTLVNWVIGGIVILLFSVLGGVSAILNVQRYINKRIPH